MKREHEVLPRDRAEIEASVLATATQRLTEFAAKKGASKVIVEIRAILGDPFPAKNVMDFQPALSPNGSTARRRRPL